MSADHDSKVTTGEIYRRLCDMDERYEKKLDRIEDQVRTTNGRTTVLETTITNHGRELGKLNSAVFPRHAATATTTAADTGESFSVKISPAIWKLISAGAGAAGAFLLQKWAGQ